MLYCSVSRLSIASQQLRAVSFLLMMTISAGCAGSQGFDRAAMREALHLDPPPASDNQQPVNQQTPPSPPLRLGVLFVDRDFLNNRSIKKVDWLSTDRDQLLHELLSLTDGKMLTDMFVLMDATLRGDDIRGIRQAGGRYGADVVLIVDGVAAVDRYNNRFSWLYPTLIGAYLAPGTESDALVMSTGSLWAVRSDWQAPIQTVEGRSKMVGSAVFVEDTATLQEAKQRAIHALATRISDHLQSIK